MDIRDSIIIHKLRNEKKDGLTVCGEEDEEGKRLKTVYWG